MRQIGWLTQVLCVVGVTAFAEHSTQRLVAPAAAKVSAPGIRYDAASAELNALNLSPDADTLIKSLKSKEPWLCSRSYQVTGNLHQMAAEVLRNDGNAATKRSYVDLQEGAAARALKEATGDMEALIAVAINYRFTPSGEKAALLALMGLRSRGEWVSAALMAKGILKDGEKGITKDEGSRKLALLALSIYANAGFGREYSALKTKLGSYPLTEKEKAEINKYQAPVTQYQSFQESWTEFAATESRQEREIPIRLKLALNFGASPNELPEMFSDKREPNGLCLLLQPPTEIGEWTSLVKADLGKHYSVSIERQIKELTRILGATDVYNERVDALERLEKLEAIPALIAALSNKEGYVRDTAAEALGNIAERAVPALITALSDKNDNVRFGAASALSKIGEKAPTAIPALITALSDKHGHVRSTAGIALSKVGEKAVPALITALSDKNDEVRRGAGIILGNIGEKAHTAIPGLIKALSDQNNYVRFSAAYALGRIGEKAHTATPALITALSDKNDDVRYSAADALGRIGEKADTAIPALITALSDKNSRVRSSAASVLGTIGEKAVPALITALSDKNDDLRLGAGIALGRIGEKASTAVPALITAVSDENDPVRYVALRALGNIGEKAHTAIPTLITALSDKNDEVRRVALFALGKIGEKAILALEDFVKQSTDVDAVKMAKTVISSFRENRE